MESQASLAVPVVTSYNTKTSNIRAVEGDVASCELVTKYPFIRGGVTVEQAGSRDSRTP